MRLIFAFLTVCTALLLSACAEQSLMSDEEYTAHKGPAPHSPDYSNVLPQPSSRPPGY